MLLYLILHNVQSERESMNTNPLRLDRLWLVGYDLNHEKTNHSKGKTWSFLCTIAYADSWSIHYGFYSAKIYL